MGDVVITDRQYVLFSANWFEYFGPKSAQISQNLPKLAQISPKGLSGRWGQSHVPCPIVHYWALSGTVGHLLTLPGHQKSGHNLSGKWQKLTKMLIGSKNDPPYFHFVSTVPTHTAIFMDFFFFFFFGLEPDSAPQDGSLRPIFAPPPKFLFLFYFYIFFFGTQFWSNWTFLPFLVGAVA